MTLSMNIVLFVNVALVALLLDIRAWLLRVRRGCWGQCQRVVFFNPACAI